MLPPDAAGVYAARAARAYAAMQGEFRTSAGLYRRDEGLRLPWTPAHVWPVARATVATLDLAGIEEGLLGDFDAAAAIADHLDLLERYYDDSAALPAYSSDVIGTRLGGDRYYDDNAWVGLALVQLERMHPGRSRLDRVEDVYRFAVAGWDRRTDVPSPGGVFWVEQESRKGAKNHDRNTVSNAPNAELGLHLAELRAASASASASAPAPAPGSIGPEDMVGWVLATLDGGGDGTGLFWDKIRGDHSIDKTLWSYNQGNMVGAAVLFARRGGADAPAHLARAEATARKALRHYGGGGFERQPAEFNAILFRNLLLLHAASGDAGLREEIIAAMHGYADRVWDEQRDGRDRFHFGERGLTLLGQSAMVQVLALLAWDPGDYEKLA